MSIDLFGPSLPLGGTTIRPGETRAFAGTDTFFKDCSDPSLDDGTELMAAWFNQMLANARQIARANGQTGTAVDIVTQDNEDDNVLLKAVQFLIQRQMTNYAVDSGTADALVVSLSPSMPEMKAGAGIIRVKKANVANATTTPTILVNGVGPATIVNADGTALEAGQLAANGLLDLKPDGTNWRLVTPHPSATVAEAEAGVLFQKFISPATLLQHRTPYFILSDGGGSTSLPNNTNTNLTHLTVDTGHYLNDGSSSVASSRFTCGTKDAGLWLLGAYYGVNGANLQHNVAVALNGVGSPIQTSNPAGSTSGFSVVRGARLGAGDVVQIQAYQLSGGTESAQSAQLFGARVSG